MKRNPAINIQSDTTLDIGTTATTMSSYNAKRGRSSRTKSNVPSHAMHPSNLYSGSGTKVTENIFNPPQLTSLNSSSRPTMPPVAESKGSIDK